MILVSVDSEMGPGERSCNPGAPAHAEDLYVKTPLPSEESSVAGRSSEARETRKARYMHRNARHDFSHSRAEIAALVCSFLLLSAALPAAEEPPPAADAAARPEPAEQQGAASQDPSAPALAERQAADADPSYFTQLWELDTRTRRGKFTLAPHASNYIMPFTYNFNPNQEAVRAASPDRELTKSEVAFQLSMKVKLWQDILGEDVDAWFAYTQRSFWQLYNFEDSSPFRETNYEPELILNWRTRYEILGLKGRFFNVGINHQSNGQSEPLSRSWNRIMANVGVETGKLSLQLRAWYRLPEDREDDDNPATDKFYGYGELWGYYFLGGHRLGVMLRNTFRARENRGAVQLEWTMPLFERVALYTQYYYGYGESLLDYNHETNRVGVGMILQ